MAGKGVTKKKIVDAAWTLFQSKGYYNTTIEEIISASGTSKSSFYHYFAGKDELLSSLSDLFDDYYRELVAAMDPGLNSFDKLVLLCCKTHEMIQSRIDPELLATMYSSQVVTRGDKHLLNRNRYYYRIVQQIVDEGQRRGEITGELPGYEIASYYTMCERAIIYDYCISDAAYDLGRFTARTIPMLLESIRAKAPEQGQPGRVPPPAL